MQKLLIGVIMIVALLSLVGCTKKEDYLILVNKERPIPSDWESRVHIDTVENCYGEEIQIEHRTYAAFKKLREDLLENDGIQIELDSVYRSVEEQQEIWDYWSADPEKGEEYCKQYLAPPGGSEHHTGLAVDIFLIKDGQEIRENNDMIADEVDFEIIHQKMPKYGFILRYLPGKEDITGYNFEPWHMRYLDDPRIAKDITEKGLTYEEYLGVK